MEPINSTYAIVCAEHDDTILYTEVIQAIAPRQRYWVRPLFLCKFSVPALSVTVQFAPAAGSDSESSAESRGSEAGAGNGYRLPIPIATYPTDELCIDDLRSCSDLLCPSHWFRDVLDTELIPLLSYLEPDPGFVTPFSEPRTDAVQLANSKLHTFIQQRWDADAHSN